VSPWKVILATMIIFGSGVITGALVIKTTQRGGHSHEGKQTASVHAKEAKNNSAPPWVLQRVEFQRKMEKQLDLTPDQKTRIEKIMHESQEHTKPLWDQIAPQMREELKKVHEQIRAELTPTQQKKFEELLKKPNRKSEDSPRRALTNNASPKQPAANTP